MAAKVCESPRKYRDVIVCCDCAQKAIAKPGEREPPLLDLQSFKFVDLKEQLMENERLILRELGFSIYKLLKDNAHKWLIQLITELFRVEAADGLQLI